MNTFASLDNTLDFSCQTSPMFYIVFGGLKMEADFCSESSPSLSVGSDHLHVKVVERKKTFYRRHQLKIFLEAVSPGSIFICIRTIRNDSELTDEVLEIKPDQPKCILKMNYQKKNLIISISTQIIGPLA